MPIYPTNIKVHNHTWRCRMPWIIRGWLCQTRGHYIEFRFPSGGYSCGRCHGMFDDNHQPVVFS